MGWLTACWSNIGWPVAYLQPISLADRVAVLHAIARCYGITLRITRCRQFSRSGSSQ
jgi:hypothetical protein